MTFASFKNARIVRSGWLEEGGRRLDCNPYMSGALEARDALTRLDAKKEKLRDLTERIFHAGREGRVWVNDRKHGVPFLGSSDILSADLVALPLISKKLVERNPLFTLGDHWTLISRSGTVGRMAYVRPDMAGMACSEHVLRVVPKTSRIPSGYLFAFLSSSYGVPLVVSGTYGAIIQHIEPEHIADLPVPRFDPAFEASVHEKVNEAASLLSKYQSHVTEATDDFFSAVGLKDITAAEWHSTGSDLGFDIASPNVTSLRALNFNPRLMQLRQRIERGPHMSLNDICLPGTLSRGGRFKRVDAAPGHAYQMIGQKELFWLKPEGRWIAKSAMDSESLGVPGAVMIAAQGTLGESEMYCRAEFIWGPWSEMAFSEHILRVIADETVMPRGCLYAFMRSETAFRMLRSISNGSKLQDHHYRMRGEMPVPYPEPDIQQAIHTKVVAAYEARHRAVVLLNEATRLVECQIGGEVA
jgi:type I restriction enzyme S subunit